MAYRNFILFTNFSWTIYVFFVSIELSLFYIKRNKSFVVSLDLLIPTIDVKYRPNVKSYGDKAWKVQFQLYHKYLKYFYIYKKEICNVQF